MERDAVIPETDMGWKEPFPYGRYGQCPESQEKAETEWVGYEDAMQIGLKGLRKRKSGAPETWINQVICAAEQTQGWGHGAGEGIWEINHQARCLFRDTGSLQNPLKVWEKAKVNFSVSP